MDFTHWSQSKRCPSNPGSSSGSKRGALLAVAVLLAAAACGTDGSTSGPDPRGARTLPLTTCPWDPGFSVTGCSQNEWWVEFAVKDASTVSMQVEVAGSTVRIIKLGTRIPLSDGSVKFTGSPGTRLRAGTLVRVKVTQSAAAGGKVATSNWIPYLQATPTVECPPTCTPSCAPSACGVADGCGGTCGPCSAGSACVNGVCTCVPSCGSNRCGADGCGGSCGTCAAGQTCTGGQCVCTPSCAAGTCGASDGCGGTCRCGSASVCTAAGSCCTPNTNACGPDGCGGDHGPCGGGCGWDPQVGSVECFGGEWWLEFSALDTAGAMQVEVTTATGTRTVGLPSRLSLGGGLVKFTGGPGSRVPAGTLVRVKVTQTAAAGGQQAQTLWFAYLQHAPVLDCQPGCTPACAAGACGTADGCGGTCGPCAAGLSCVNNACVCVPSCGSNQCGSDGCGGTCGTCGTQQVCANGRCTCQPSCAPGACGVSDGCGGTCACASGLGCVAGACVCVPSCGSNGCGSDGCGGSCGTCGAGQTCAGGRCTQGCVAPWDPQWAQLASAGAWWTEFTVVGGGVLTTAVVVENVATGALHPLQFDFGRWAGGVSNLQSGAQVVLRATNALGATARTMPFRYLVDTAPVTNPCGGTAATNTTCPPLSRGKVTFSFDDSGASQPSIALPLLQRYGVKGTFFVVPPWHSWLSVARTMLADGHEFAAHSMTHRTLTTLSAGELDDELRLSREWIQANIGGTVDSFATPSAAFNDTVVNAAKRYFRNHRGGEDGLNFVGSDVYRLKSEFVLSSSTVAGVCARVRDAAAQKGWLFLTIHDLTNSASSTQGFTITAAVFEGILACATTTPGIDVVTARQATAELRCGSPP